VELHFFPCRLLGEPAPQIGQDMRWVTREELGALSFPPADMELIQWLIQDRP
jgi:8-oxo-dGTP diphosphatase